MSQPAAVGWLLPGQTQQTARTPRLWLGPDRLASHAEVFVVLLATSVVRLWAPSLAAVLSVLRSHSMVLPTAQERSKRPPVGYSALRLHTANQDRVHSACSATRLVWVASYAYTL